MIFGDTDGQPGEEILVLWTNEPYKPGIDVIHDVTQTINRYPYNNYSLNPYGLSDTDNLPGNEIILVFGNDTEKGIDVLHDGTGVTNRYPYSSVGSLNIYNLSETDGRPGNEIVTVWYNDPVGRGIDAIRDIDQSLARYSYWGRDFGLYDITDTDGLSGEEMVVWWQEEHDPTGKGIDVIHDEHTNSGVNAYPDSTFGFFSSILDYDSIPGNEICYVQTSGNHNLIIDRTQEVVAQGTGGCQYILPPQIGVEPTSYDFGGVLKGHASSATFTVTNSGGGMLIIGAVTLDKHYTPLPTLDGDPYSIHADDCSNHNIAPAGSCEITVRFYGSDFPPFSTQEATLVIPSNDPFAPTVEVPMVGGTAMMLPDDISVSPAEYDFGGVYVDAPNPPTETFIVSHTEDLQYCSSVYIEGPDVDEFDIVFADCCEFVDWDQWPRLKADCPIEVAFSPLTEGSKLASLMAFGVAVPLQGEGLLPRHLLTTMKSGSGSGAVTSEPAGIDCGTDCSEDFLEGTTVTLSADPGFNSAFMGWSGGNCSGVGPCIVSMDAPKAVTATFAENVPVTGDWNGDGVTDVGIFRDGQWYIDSNGDHVWQAGVDETFQQGQAGDLPVTGDWNNDGVTDVGIFRDGTWYIDSNGDHVWQAGVDETFQQGQAGDLPVTGDWNNDGVTDGGIFRDGTWFIDSDGDHAWQPGVDETFQQGPPASLPVTGDWNNDGVTDVGVLLDSVWYLDSNGDHVWEIGVDATFELTIY